MASAVGRLSRAFLNKNVGAFSCNPRVKPRGTAVVNHCRNVVSSASGAIMPKPEKTPFGLLRMTIVVVPFLYVGTLISKNFAALLEEHEIFVPDDDDDDD